jgi:hypothetical protein
MPTPEKPMPNCNPARIPEEKQDPAYSLLAAIQRSKGERCERKAKPNFTQLRANRYVSPLIRQQSLPAVLPPHAGSFSIESTTYILVGFGISPSDKVECRILKDLTFTFGRLLTPVPACSFLPQFSSQSTTILGRTSDPLMQNQKDIKYNTKLIQAMGGDFYDPFPPDHILWQIEHGSPADQFTAVIQWHTCHEGHPAPGYGPRSPYAVNEEGAPLTLDEIGQIIYGFTKAGRM